MPGPVRESTILIVARNAAPTIARAVRSCLPEACPVVVVDDHSTDDTAARAVAAGGATVRVYRAPAPGGVGLARQTALDSVETAFAAWLDADDEWVPGRMQRLAALLRRGCDVATEDAELYDGPSGARLRRVVVPAFLKEPWGPIRLFERNYLPNDTAVAFRVSAYRDAGGYDAGAIGTESFDVLLRVLAKGGRMAFAEGAGYRIHAYPSSLSRDLDRQRSMYRRILLKHDYGVVRQLLEAHGVDRHAAAWTLASLAQFRQEYESARGFIEESAMFGHSPGTIVEPGGPCSLPEGWRLAFWRGTVSLLEGRHREAARQLDAAERVVSMPESSNNLGVALWNCGRERDSQECFARAARMYPGYADGLSNLNASRPARITTHPLRRDTTRDDYPTDSAG